MCSTMRLTTAHRGEEVAQLANQEAKHSAGRSNVEITKSWDNTIDIEGHCEGLRLASQEASQVVTRRLMARL